MPRQILVADDDPVKRKFLTETVQAASPNATVHVASTAREAIWITAMIGETLEAGVIDYDFIGEHQNGADIIKALREKNRGARILCATSRPEGESFDEASAATLTAGADEVVCTLTAGAAGRVGGFVG